jgi:hypothetical protein
MPVDRMVTKARASSGAPGSGPVLGHLVGEIGGGGVGVFRIVQALEEEADRRLQEHGRGVQLAGADAVRTALVLLHLLEGQAQGVGHGLLGVSEVLAAHPQAATHVDIDGIRGLVVSHAHSLERKVEISLERPRGVRDASFAPAPHGGRLPRCDRDRSRGQTKRLFRFRMFIPFSRVGAEAALPLVENVAKMVVRAAGVEPARAEAQRILSPVRLPVSPRPLKVGRLSGSGEGRRARRVIASYPRRPVWSQMAMS